MSADECPECAGARLLEHPAGPLVFSHAADCQLGAAEDSRKVADASFSIRTSRGWTRPTTETERQLLAHVYSVQPDTVPETAELQAVAGVAVLRRDWPGLTYSTTGSSAP